MKRDTTWAEKKGKMEKRRVKKTMGYNLADAEVDRGFRARSKITITSVNGKTLRCRDTSKRSLTIGNKISKRRYAGT